MILASLSSIVLPSIGDCHWMTDCEGGLTGAGGVTGAVVLGTIGAHTIGATGVIFSCVVIGLFCLITGVGGVYVCSGVACSQTAGISPACAIACLLA